MAWNTFGVNYHATFSSMKAECLTTILKKIHGSHSTQLHPCKTIKLSAEANGTRCESNERVFESRHPGTAIQD